MKFGKASRLMALSSILSLIIATAGFARDNSDSAKSCVINGIEKVAAGNTGFLLAKKDKDKKEKKKIEKAIKKAKKKGDKGEGTDGGMASQKNMEGSKQVTKPPTIIIEGQGTVRH